MTDAKNKAIPSPKDNAMPYHPGAKVVCVRECEVPGFGSFKSGDYVEDQTFAEKVITENHPNFKISDREDK